MSSNPMKSQGNMVSQQQNDNSPATEFKGMGYCNLTDKEFKIAIMKNSISYKKIQKGNLIN